MRDTLGVTGKLANRSHILNLIGINIRGEGESLRYTPEQNLSRDLLVCLFDGVSQT